MYFLLLFCDYSSLLFCSFNVPSKDKFACILMHNKVFELELELDLELEHAWKDFGTCETGKKNFH